MNYPTGWVRRSCTDHLPNTGTASMQAKTPRAPIP